MSASSRAVSNLQGVWADGATSAWSGDYHLNINLQMNYWAANTLFEGKTLSPPLLEFIERMAIAGEDTADFLYHCKGWVGHGFTDSLMGMGIRGDAQWALCATCGAWLGLHLWDYVSFNQDIQTLRHTLLPVYKSMATFYLEYLFKDKHGTVHSGPTTSPENSFLGSVYKKSKSNSTNGINGTKWNKASHKYYPLTLSPAIDISILRQVQ